MADVIFSKVCWLHLFVCSCDGKMTASFVANCSHFYFLFSFGCKMSMHYLWHLNNRMENELNYQLDIVQKKRQHLHKYWYTLKFFTYGMHAIYRLFHEFLVIYGNQGLYDKCEYQDLLYGPRSITDNCCILYELCKIVDLQVVWIGCIVRFTHDMKAINDAVMIFKWVIRFLDMLLLHDDVSSEYTFNGLPIKYEFL